jgi:hypothetical protein
MFIDDCGGREGIRTPGLLVANEALSQLSYSPTSSNQILANAPRVANLRSSMCEKHKARFVRQNCRKDPGQR